MRSFFLLLTAALAFQACIPLNTPGATGNNVYVGNYFFTPVIDSSAALRNDTTVITFRWADTATGIGHRVIWDSVVGGDSTTVLPGNDVLRFSGTYEVGLTKGRYYYHCAIHGGPDNSFGMDGQIVVLPFGFSPPTSARPIQSPRLFSGPAVVTQPSPAAVQASPRPAAPRSPPATS